MFHRKLHSRSLRNAAFTAAAGLGLPGLMGSLGCTPDENELEGESSESSESSTTGGESPGSSGSTGPGPTPDDSTGSGPLPETSEGDTSTSGASSDSGTSANTTEGSTGSTEDSAEASTTGDPTESTGGSDSTSEGIASTSDSGTTGDGESTSGIASTSTGEIGLESESGLESTGESGLESTGDGGLGSTDDGGADDGDPPDDGLIIELSDEFDDPDTFDDWLLRHEVEGTPAQYSVLDIDTSAPGMLTWLPTTSGWYADFVGPFMFKLVDGDFMIEAHVIARSRNVPDAAPSELYNSAGIMVRDPNSAPGQQNWVAHNVGRQDLGTGIATENKTTFNSGSQLFLFAGTYRGVLRICRVGNVFVMTRRLDGEADFVETRRFTRTFPDEVQVGMVASGWNSNGSTPNFDRTPDLQAEFEYVRFYEVDDEARCLED